MAVSRGRDASKKNDGYCRNADFTRLAMYAKPILRIATTPSMNLIVVIMNGLVPLLSFGTAFAGIIFAAGQLGPIRTVSPILVLISLLATILLNPGRLLRTGGCGNSPCSSYSGLGCCCLDCRSSRVDDTLKQLTYPWVTLMLAPPTPPCSVSRL